MNASAQDPTRTWVYWFTLALAILTYVYGLDSLHIPKNGDEYVYTHILRETAESKNLLPLQSELDGMRNTKPPMIYWQGIVSTNWAQDWQQWQLRWPSLIYTFLTGLLVFLLLRKEAGIAQAFTGLFLFLAFITSYRYGRPYLTDPPMVFWLSLPAFALLWSRPGLFHSKLLFPLQAGLALGIAFLYKSFMLLLPVGLTFAIWYWRERDYLIVPFMIRDSYKLVLMALISLTVFSVWFVFDPDPQAILQEFVFKENVGKVSQDNYLAKLLWGGSSIWSQAAGLVVNTGLLLVPTIVMFWLAWRHRREQGAVERMLWIWVAVYFVIFCLPTQRSARYLIPVMPAVAVLLALYWHRLPTWALRTSLAVAALTILGVTAFTLKLQTYFGESATYPAYIWMTLVAALALTVFAFTRPQWIHALTPASLLSVYLVLAAFFHPFDHQQGQYDNTAQNSVAGKQVAVPHNFRAKYERYRFLLPDAEIIGYRSDQPFSLKSLKQDYEYFSYRHPSSQQPDYSGCELLGTRIEVRTRHNSQEIREILFDNRMDHLFVDEDLLYCPNQNHSKSSFY